jgi:hypothetical protein
MKASISPCQHSVSSFSDRHWEMWTPMWRWLPEHSRHIRMPRLMEAQSGAAAGGREVRKEREDERGKRACGRCGGGGGRSWASWHCRWASLRPPGTGCKARGQGGGGATSPAVGQGGGLGFSSTHKLHRSRRTRGCRGRTQACPPFFFAVGCGWGGPGGAGKWSMGSSHFLSTRPGWLPWYFVRREVEGGTFASPP